MEDSANSKKCYVKRIRTMENIQSGGGGGGGGGSGGTEIRRIHVIYFLSRKGRIEHPHLIRVHHLSRNGVHLRDVKRWLAELRGKDMPESFAWSYKRKYKSGYVWQDLLDDDLITPISDNEYVIKGSEIPPTYTKDSYNESNENEKEEEEESPKSPLNKEEVEDSAKKMEEPNNGHCEIEQESRSFGSEKSVLSDVNSIKVDEEEQEKHSRESKHDVREENDSPTTGNSSSSSSSSPSKNKDKKGSNGTFSRSKSNSNGASHLFRNLMTCGTVDTRDSTTVLINRRNKPPLNTNTNSTVSCGDLSSDQSSFERSIEISKGDKFGGSQRVFGTSKDQPPQFPRRSYDGPRSTSHSKSSEFTSPKPIAAAYKPVNGPPCSQCGKQFKPEKLHAHMKSCKGLKAVTKANSVSAANTEKSSDRSAEFPMDKYSVSGYYLTERR